MIIYVSTIVHSKLTMYKISVDFVSAIRAWSVFHPGLSISVLAIESRSTTNKALLKATLLRLTWRITHLNLVCYTMRTVHLSQGEDRIWRVTNGTYAEPQEQLLLSWTRPGWKELCKIWHSPQFYQIQPSPKGKLHSDSWDNIKLGVMPSFFWNALKWF